MSGIESLEFVLRFLHMIGAAGLLGAIFFMRFGLWGAVASAPAKEREFYFACFNSAARKFAPWVGIFAAFVLISGIYNMMNAMKFDYPGRYYNPVVGIKLLIGIAVIGLLSVLCGRTSTAEKFRKNAGMWLDLCMVLTLAIVLMGGLLRIAERTPKSAAPAADPQQPAGEP
jgi:uncharacterized membrane protein